MDSFSEFSAPSLLLKGKMEDKVNPQRETCLLGILSLLVKALCWVSAKRAANGYHPASWGGNSWGPHAPRSDSSNDSGNKGSWQEQTAPSGLPISPVPPPNSWDGFVLTSRCNKLKGTDNLTSLRIIPNVLYFILIFKYFDTCSSLACFHELANHGGKNQVLDIYGKKQVWSYPMETGLLRKEIHDFYLAT